MPSLTPCRICGAIGFVRKEHILKGASGHTLYYCGQCNRSWTEPDTPTARDTRGDMKTRD
jgi:transposase-like protein